MGDFDLGSVSAFLPVTILISSILSKTSSSFG